VVGNKIQLSLNNTKPLIVLVLLYTEDILLSSFLHY